MSSILSIITVIVILYVYAFALSFVVIPSSESKRLTSTEKQHKASIPIWNLLAVEEGIPTKEENVPILVGGKGKPVK